MTLADTLAEARTTWRRGFTPEQVRTMDYAAQWLAQSGVEGGALRSGELTPEFTLADTNGRVVRLIDRLDRGPVVLTFTCGSWCPLCAAVLAAYAPLAPLIAASGATLLAISPMLAQSDPLAVADAFEGLTRLSDPGAKVCQLFGLRYPVPGPLQAVYRARGIDLTDRNGGPTAFLPIPASYVIDQSGMAAAAFVCPNHRDCAEPEAIVAAVGAVERKREDDRRALGHAH
ncbi:MAG TPA: peroxiredoxin-like family protein [Candidatus Defluviicoccus seviourii]|nr:peroxiredoxin-like family protein [Candidatus Defluviicoccus seviourii]